MWKTLSMKDAWNNFRQVLFTATHKPSPSKAKTQTINGAGGSGEIHMGRIDFFFISPELRRAVIQVKNQN